MEECERARERATRVPTLPRPRGCGCNGHDTLAHFTAVAAVIATAAGSFRSLLDGRRGGGQVLCASRVLCATELE